MKLTRKTRLGLFIGNIFLVLLIIIGCISVYRLAIMKSARFDMSSLKSNTLSEQSLAVVKQIEGPVTVKAFVGRNNSIRQAIKDIFAKYQQHKKDIKLHFINPELVPDEVRSNKIQKTGEMIISYGDKSQHVSYPREQDITNALIRVSRKEKKWVAFLSGHGERHILGAANFDWGDFGKHLTKKGFAVQLLDLSTSPSIPDNISALVIGSPQTDLLPGEVEIIQEYIARGGSLLVTIDPYEYNGLELLMEKIGVGFIDGVVHDPNVSILYKIQDPTFSIIVNYSDHPITKTLESVTLFPKAMAFEILSEDEFKIAPLLQTLPQSWSRPINSSPTTSQGKKGPLNMGLVLTKDGKEKQQRIVVIGDGDFLSNQILGNGSNLALGEKVINWICGDDKKILIPVRKAEDSKLELPFWLAFAIEYIFKILLPLFLIIMGIFIWIYRRRR